MMGSVVTVEFAEVEEPESRFSGASTGASHGDRRIDR